MKTCPFCAEEIRDEAIKCRWCGEFLDGSGRGRAPVYPVYPGYEYRSEIEIGGWPLLHVAQGIDPETGRPRVARGIVAVGNVAIGLFALGGIAFGGIAIGGIGMGVVALAGMSFGILALGGLSVGIWFAAGGLAISAMYAVGGMALAPHAISSLGADPELLRRLEEWWPGITERFGGGG